MAPEEIDLMKDKQIKTSGNEEGATEMNQDALVFRPDSRTRSSQGSQGPDQLPGLAYDQDSDSSQLSRTHRQVASFQDPVSPKKCDCSLSDELPLRPASAHTLMNCSQRFTSESSDPRDPKYIRFEQTAKYHDLHNKLSNISRGRDKNIECHIKFADQGTPLHRAAHDHEKFHSRQECLQIAMDHHAIATFHLKVVAEMLTAALEMMAEKRMVTTEQMNNHPQIALAQAPGILPEFANSSQHTIDEAKQTLICDRDPNLTTRSQGVFPSPSRDKLFSLLSRLYGDGPRETKRSLLMDRYFEVTPPNSVLPAFGCLAGSPPAPNTNTSKHTGAYCQEQHETPHRVIESEKKANSDESRKNGELGDSKLSTKVHVQSVVNTREVNVTVEIEPPTTETTKSAEPKIVTKSARSYSSSFQVVPHSSVDANIPIGAFDIALRQRSQDSRVRRVEGRSSASTQSGTRDSKGDEQHSRSESPTKRRKMI